MKRNECRKRKRKRTMASIIEQKTKKWRRRCKPTEKSPRNDGKIKIPFLGKEL